VKAQQHVKEDNLNDAYWLLRQAGYGTVTLPACQLRPEAEPEMGLDPERAF
jgi:hypothetical protein